MKLGFIFAVEISKLKNKQIHMRSIIFTLMTAFALGAMAQEIPTDSTKTKKPKTRAAITEKGIPSKAAKAKKKDEPMKKESSKESPKAKTNKP